MRYLRFFILAVITFSGMSATLLADNIVVTGRVVDNSGEPLPGVSVLEKGTDNGVLTDKEGSYSIEVSDVGVLSFACMGFEPLEIAVGDKNLKLVILKEDTILLKETVVIGYGTISRNTLANSVSTVSEKEMIQGAVSNPLQMLQGKVAGLSVSSSSGDPNNGAATQVMLRGVSTLMCNQEPIVVIDGITSGGLSNVTPDDILTINVLKDGAAAAIYGTKGTNGVILITTKRGARVNNSISYHGYVSIESISNKIDVFAPEEYKNLKELTDGAFIPLDNGANTNWGRETFRPAINHYHNVSINGGNMESDFYAGITYNSRQGIIKGSKLDKLYLSAGTNRSFFDRTLKISANLSNILARGSQVSEEDAYLGTLIANPTSPVYNKNTGDYSIFAGVPNPVKSVNEFREDVCWDQMSADGKITYAPIEGLSLNAVGGLKIFSHFNGAYGTKAFSDNTLGGQAWRNTSYKTTFSGDLYASYDKRIKKQDINAVLGYSYYSYNLQKFGGYNYDFPTDLFEYNNMGLGLALKEGKATMNSHRRMDRLISFFTRINYSYDSRYIVALSCREDGSSKFGPKNRWGAFWSASAAWRIKGERFLENADWLNELKLKFSYGVTGVEPSLPYLSKMTYNYGNPVYMGGKYTWTISPSAVANPNLKWEEKHEYNLGLEFSMFDSRYSGNVDFYHRNTRDLLYSYNVPVPPNLASTIYANVGSISNTGVEIALSGVPVKTKDFTMNISGNVSYNANKIRSLSDELYKRDFMEVGFTGSPVQKTTHLVKEGGAIGDFYGWKSTGLKKNGAWEVEGGVYGSEKARRIIGNGIPKVNAGLTLQTECKGFDLAIALRGFFLFHILNQYRMLWETFQKGQQYNYPTSILEKPYGSEYYLKNISPSYVSYFVERGDFLKIDNVTWGYNFRFKPQCAVKTLRLYLSGMNLFTFTKYKGIDPEVNFIGLSPGIDYTSTYPTTRTVSLGVKFGF